MVLSSQFKVFQIRKKGSPLGLQEPSKKKTQIKTAKVRSTVVTFVTNSLGANLHLHRSSM